MKIVKIIGGLGNQMFQYALYRSLKSRFPDEDIKVDTSLYHSYKLHNGLELERVFTITLDVAAPREIRQVSRYFQNFLLQRICRKLLPNRRSELIQKGDADYIPEVFQKGKNIYYEGFWQNEKYFSDIRQEIRTIYEFPGNLSGKNHDVAMAMQDSGTSVSIHVRRGDYLKHAMYCQCCSEEYYKKAMAEMRRRFSNITFYIFSDDSDWCAGFFEPLLLPGEKMLLVDWNHGEASHIDMRLMTMARGMIIANSSFSWWAAWLNRRDDKTVIAPSRWLTIAPVNDRQLPDWILI